MPAVERFRLSNSAESVITPEMRELLNVKDASLERGMSSWRVLSRVAVVTAVVVGTGCTGTLVRGRSFRMLTLVLCSMAIGCAEHHPPGDAEVADGAPTDAPPGDVGTTVCGFLITASTPCPADCLSVYGLVLESTATCLDEASPREIVWCATQGRISSFSGDCYRLPDGTRVDVQWTPMNQPSDEHCNLPVCLP